MKFADEYPINVDLSQALVALEERKARAAIELQEFLPLKISLPPRTSSSRSSKPNSTENSGTSPKDA